MSIDFEVPAEAKAIRTRVRKWVQEECIPAEKDLDTKPLDEVLGKLRKKARAQGLWCPFVPKEYGGMGLGPLANALVQMELGEIYVGALSMNSQGPDDATILTLIAPGTDTEGPRHQQFSTFIVELPNPGYRIKRDIPTMAMEGPLSHIMGGGHAE